MKQCMGDMIKEALDQAAEMLRKSKKGKKEDKKGVVVVEVMKKKDK
jgi:hypothetical protein